MPVGCFQMDVCETDVQKFFNKKLGVKATVQTTKSLHALVNLAHPGLALDLVTRRELDHETGPSVFQLKQRQPRSCECRVLPAGTGRWYLVAKMRQRGCGGLYHDSIR